MIGCMVGENTYARHYMYIMLYYRTLIELYSASIESVLAWPAYKSQMIFLFGLFFEKRNKPA